jgi:hypothetical protein
MNATTPSLGILAAATLAFAACSASDEAATEARAAEPAAAAPQVMAAPGCFLQRGTLAEAAERASPLDSATVALGGAEAKVCYGSPSLRGRVMLGEVEPFGQPWRSGANEATGLHVAFRIEVAGATLEPGSYSLYTIPGESSWEVVVNAAHERWGIPIGEEVRASDLGSITVDAETLDEPVERLTWRWERHSDTEADLILEWQTTRIRIPAARVEG